MRWFVVGLIVAGVAAAAGALAVGVAQLLKAPGWVTVVVGATSTAVAGMGSLGAQFIWPAFTARRDAEAARLQAWERVVDPWPWPKASGTEQPLELLDAHHAVTRFRSRGRELAELLKWCRDPAAGAVWMVCGPAGVGKTRLAVRLAQDLTEADQPAQRWAVGAAHPGLAAEAVRAAAGLGRPVLLVVDQADTRTDVTAALTGPPTAGVRVLLLTREPTDGPWWTALRRTVTGQPGKTAIAQAGRTTLGPLVTGRDAQQQVFAKAVDEYAHALSMRTPTVRLGHAEPDAPVLMLHAAALAAVLRRRPRQDPVDADTQLWRELLDHEAGMWQAALDRHGLTLPADTQRQIIAAAALVGADDEAATIDLLDQVRDLAGTDRMHRRRVAEWLHGLYPGAGTEWLARIEPPPLAEHLVTTGLAGDPALTGGLLADLPPSRMPRVLALLADTHHPWASTQLEHLLRTRPTLALPAACRLTSLTRNLDARIAACLDDPALTLPDGFLDQLWAQLPDARFTVRLSRAVAAAARRRLTTPTGDAVDHARRTHDLAYALGWRYDPTASATAAKAVDQWRVLATADPDAHQPGLASALTTLARVQRDAGHADQAEAAAAEAVTCWRVLAAADPDAYQRGLADALTTLADAQRDAAHIDLAETAAAEAVACWRALATADGNRSFLATALNILAQVQQAAGHPDQAVSAAEAVTCWRVLAAADPDAYQRGLASALNTLADMQRPAGDVDQAMHAVADAAACWRVLTAADPDAYQRGLASALNTLADVQRDAGHADQAVSTAAEAVACYRVLAAVSPHAHQILLARALISLAAAQRDAGHADQAMSTATEAVTWWRQLATTDGNRSFLATALKILAAAQRDARNVNQAASTAAEAVARFRTLAAANPDAYQLSLADALMTLSRTLLARGNVPAARRAAQDAVTELTQLAARNRAHFNITQLAKAREWLHHFAER